MITNYLVTGMTCGHCVRAVTEELEALPGVSQVQLNQAGELRLTTETEPDFALVAAAVAEAGDYQVTPAR